MKSGLDDSISAIVNIYTYDSKGNRTKKITQNYSDLQLTTHKDIH